MAVKKILMQLKQWRYCSKNLIILVVCEFSSVKINNSGGRTMKHINRVFAAFIMALLLMSLSACAPSLVAPVVTSTPEATAEVTAIPTSTPVPTEMPVPTLSPEEEKEILNQQLQDFLNKEGEFTEEKMNRLPIYAYGCDPKDGSNLGILRVYSNENDKDRLVSVYGYLFDVIEHEDRNIILVMGFDGKNGNRFITTLGVDGSVYDYYHNLEDNDEKKDSLAFWFNTEEGLYLDSNSVPQFRASSSEQILDYLKVLKGKKIVATVPGKYLNLNGFKGSAKPLWELSNKNFSSTSNFINTLATNGVDTSVVEPSNGELNLIYSSIDLNMIDFENVPQVFSVSYRKND